MAMFPTHIKCSTAAGIVGGTVAFLGYGVPLSTSAVGAGMCAIGGILPDIDSGPGIPLREITTFLASAVPTMLITRLLSYHLNQEMLILCGAILYIGIRFGLSHFLRHYTVHRGMFHSFPSMAIFGEITYLLFYGETVFVRTFMVSAVCLGFFIHLLLDEIYSVEWDGRPRLKRSFGTAMKFAGENGWANLTCYGKLAICTYFVLVDPSVVQQISATGNGNPQNAQVAQDAGNSLKSKFENIKEAIQAKTSGTVASFLGSSGTAANNGSNAFGSSTVPAPGATWPQTGANGYSASSGYSNAQPQTAAAGTSPWAAAGNQPASGQGYAGRSRGNAASAPVANNPYAPASNQNFAPATGQNFAPAAGQTSAPAQSASPGRFWQ